MIPASKIRLLWLMDCCKLVEVQGFPLDSGGDFNFFGCYNLSSDFRQSLLQVCSLSLSLSLSLCGLMMSFFFLEIVSVDQA
jgi:hypothetical protein